MFGFEILAGRRKRPLESLYERYERKLTSHVTVASLAPSRAAGNKASASGGADASVSAAAAAKYLIRGFEQLDVKVLFFVLSPRSSGSDAVRGRYRPGNTL